MLKYVRSDGRNFPFEDIQFDRIFTVTVLGEVEEKDIYIREYKRTLRDNGELLISEQKGGQDLIKEEGLIEMVGKHGIILIERFGNRLYFSLKFIKKNYN